MVLDSSLEASTTSSMAGAPGLVSARRSSKTRHIDATLALVHRAAVSYASQGEQHDGSPGERPGTYRAVRWSATCVGGARVTKHRDSLAFVLVEEPKLKSEEENEAKRMDLKQTAPRAG